MPPILNIFSEHRHTNIELQDRLLLEQLYEIAEEARRRDLYLLLEPVNRYETDYMNTLTHAAGIAEEAHHSHLGISADFFHMQIEELNIQESINKAGKWIKHVHVAENTRVEPGPGSLDFKPGFRALKNVGYDKYIEIEARSLSGEAAVVLPKAIAYLKNLWAIS